MPDGQRLILWDYGQTFYTLDVATKVKMEQVLPAGFYYSGNGGPSPDLEPDIPGYQGFFVVVAKPSPWLPDTLPDEEEEVKAAAG